MMKTPTARTVPYSAFASDASAQIIPRGPYLCSKATTAEVLCVRCILSTQATSQRSCGKRNGIASRVMSCPALFR